MNSKIKIYRDSGANINFLKPYLPNIALYQYPYDSADRPKKQKMELASPSELGWENAHSTWEESNFTWEDCCGSSVFNTIMKVIGKHYVDALHIDSAYKTGCHIFLTSDKTDIWSNRLELEEVCKIKFFFHKNVEEIIQYLECLINLNSL